MEMKIKNFCQLVAILAALLVASACSGKQKSAAAPLVQKTPPPPIQTSAPAKVAAAQSSKPALPVETKTQTPEPAQFQAQTVPTAQAAAEIKASLSDLPLMMTDQVASYINYFSNRGRGTLEHALQRSGRYREMIERTLKEEGVPQDLIYLAQAESGFHPFAVSRAG